MPSSSLAAKLRPRVPRACMQAGHCPGGDAVREFLPYLPGSDEAEGHVPDRSKGALLAMAAQQKAALAAVVLEVGWDSVSAITLDIPG